MTVGTPVISGKAEAQSTIRHILADNPTLWWGGWWGLLSGRRGEPGLSERRTETLGEHGIAQFVRALEFIENTPRTQKPNRHRTTYGWKHCAERWHRAHGAAGDVYVGEGAFILAATASGLTVQRDRHGFTYVNLSTREARF